MTEQQFNQVYERCKGYVTAMTKRCAVDSQKAKDAFQDIFLLLWLKAPEGKSIEELSAYCIGMTRKSVSRIINDRKIAERTVGISSWEEADFEGVQLRCPGFIDEKEELRLSNKIDKAINDLPQYLRWPLYKKYIEGKHNFFISEELKLERPIVKAYVGKGRAMIRKVLEDEYRK